MATLNPEAREPATAARPREGFLVLGVHRSGTSAVAGVLARLGARPPATLMPPTADNERGYWESQAIAVFNDELLASAGSTWDDWRSIRPDWFGTPTAAQLMDKARELLASEFADSPTFVLKDPRICRFPRFWLDVLTAANASLKVVIPLRSPLEVAQSLKARDGFPLAKGLLLWLRHALEAEAGTRDCIRAVVEWPAFLADWQAGAARMEQALDTRWPRLSDRTAEEIDAFLSADLRHHRETPGTLRTHPEVPGLVAAAYEALAELARDPDSAGARAALDDVRRRFDEASSLFGRFFATLEQQNLERQGRIATLTASLRQAEAELARLRQERDTASLEISGIRTEQETLRREFQLQSEETIASASALREVTASLEAVQAELDRERMRAEESIAAHRENVMQEMTVLTRLLEDARTERDYTQSSLRHAEAELARLRQERDTASLEISGIRTEQETLRREFQLQSEETIASASALREVTASLEAVQAELDRERMRAEESIAAHRALAEKVARLRARPFRTIAAHAVRRFRLI